MKKSKRAELTEGTCSKGPRSGYRIVQYNITTRKGGKKRRKSRSDRNQEEVPGTGAASLKCRDEYGRVRPGTNTWWSLAISLTLGFVGLVLATLKTVCTRCGCLSRVKSLYIPSPRPSWVSGGLTPTHFYNMQLVLPTCD